ncbi:MAG: bifunctional UDP-sugar hydrolase/5'-nucleotidase [Planctomycetota bacterium]
MKAAFRAVVLLVGAGILGCAAHHSLAEDPAPTTGDKHFTILQLNDIYKVEGLEHMRVGGLARARTLRRSLEGEGKPVLVLHSGDALGPSVMSKFLRAGPMIRCLNLLDGDAGAFDERFVFTPGNHEFDDRDPGLVLGRMAQSEFHWVTSNVLYKPSKDAAPKPFSSRLRNVHDTLIVDMEGVKVGLLGVTCDVQPRDYVEYGYAHSSIDTTIRSSIDELKKQGARVLVAVTHQEMGEDVRIAKAFPELDVVVGGHEHFYQEKQVGRVWVTKGDADARTVVVIDMKVPAASAVVATPRRVPLGPDVVPDPVVEAEAKHSLAELAKAMKDQTGHDMADVVATTEHALEGVEPAVRGRETALGNLLTDVLRARMETDIAFLNGGSIRINDDIPADSPISTYDLEGVFYFDNEMVAFELTGAELLDVLRRSVSEVHVGHGRFLQVSGLRFTYHASGPEDAPTYRIDASDVRVKGEPLEPTRTYSCASLDWVWQNGYRDGYAIFGAGRGKTSPKKLERPKAPSFRRATEEWMRSLPDKRVTTKIEGRITRAAD